jgi:hypothetical protein
LEKVVISMLLPNGSVAEKTVVAPEWVWDLPQGYPALINCVCARRLDHRHANENACDDQCFRARDRGVIRIPYGKPDQI